MRKHFLPLKIAIHDYVVSLITLRRLVREIVKDPNHKHRPLVRPTPEEFSELKENNRPFEYEISTELLDLKYTQRVDVLEGDPAIDDRRADAGGAALNIIDGNEFLLDQLTEKDKQIAKLQNAVEHLAESQRLQNMIRATELGLPMGQVNPLKAGQRLEQAKQASQPLASSDKPQEGVRDSEQQKDEQPIVMGAERPQPKKSATNKKRSRGVFGRIFRPSKQAATVK